MNVFLTGGNGGIGSVIRKVLINNDVEVISPTSNELDLSKDFDINQTVDGLIYCAGVNNLRHYRKLNHNEFMNLLQINTLSFIKLCGKLNFSFGSNIIAIGSLYSEGTKEERIQYTVSKHGMLGAVKTLALEMSEMNVKVNMISPGFVDTPMTRKNNTEERINTLNSMIPLGLVSSESIAELCHWFIKNNRYITGQNIKVDGGYSLRGV